MPKEVKQRSGIAIGLNKGHKVTPHQPKPKVSRTKGHLSKRTAFVREVVKEVAGYAISYSPLTFNPNTYHYNNSLAPYERRVIELLRNSKDKRARKLAKNRLGTFGRAKRKVDEMTKVIAESRRVGH
ncbi:ribosomal protein L36 [Oleoguttula sp. CCFEE 5521]